MTPMYVGNASTGYRETGRRPIFVTIAELYTWAFNKTSYTQEGEPYHDALTRYQAAMTAIAAIFNGTKTFVDPVTKQTKNLPALLTADDIANKFFYDFNVRLLQWPLFPYAWMYTEDNDEQWNLILTVFCGQVERFVKSKGLKWVRMLETLSIDYNPIADYWTKGRKQGGNAPYATFMGTNDDKEDVSVDSWSESDGKTYYRTQNSTLSGGIQTDTLTTTYDNATPRLANRAIQTGGTESSTDIPNSAYWEKYQEEGNKGAYSPQEMIEKELELSNAFDTLVDSFFRELNKEIFLSMYKGA